MPTPSVLIVAAITGLNTLGRDQWLLNGGVTDATVVSLVRGKGEMMDNDLEAEYIDDRDKLMREILKLRVDCEKAQARAEKAEELAEYWKERAHKWAEQGEQNIAGWTQSHYRLKAERDELVNLCAARDEKITQLLVERDALQKLLAEAQTERDQWEKQAERETIRADQQWHRAEKAIMKSRQLHAERDALLALLEQSRCYVTDAIRARIDAALAKGK